MYRKLMSELTASEIISMAKSSIQFHQTLQGTELCNFQYNVLVIRNNNNSYISWKYTRSRLERANKCKENCSL